MLRCLLVGSFFLVLVDGLAIAEIHKCKDAQGAIVYTDDPTNLPQGCVEEQVIELPQPNVMSPQATTSAEQSAKAPEPAQGTTPPQQEDDLYSSFKSKAVGLVETFSLSRKKVFRSTLASDKKKARRELKDVSSEKKALLLEVEKSPLTRAEKRVINGILSAITE